jgi:hypothetical protein
MTQRTISVLRTHDDRTIPVPGTYTIDGPHTSVEFVARHLVITKVRGRFDEVRGSIFIAEDPEPMITFRSTATRARAERSVRSADRVLASSKRFAVPRLAAFLEVAEATLQAHLGPRPLPCTARCTRSTCGPGTLTPTGATT